VEVVKRWLREHHQWLLILDNADDLGMVSGFLPETYPGHILLTTRAMAMGRLAKRIELDRMEQAEGTLFLLRRAGILEAGDPIDKVSSRDQANALSIVQAMDGLPLALDQAGAYIVRKPAVAWLAISPATSSAEGTCLKHVGAIPPTTRNRSPPPGRFRSRTWNGPTLSRLTCCASAHF
jgi:hypothetical protein